MAGADGEPLPPEIAHHAELDARMEVAVRDIRLLQSASWPQAAQQTFLESWRAGSPALSVVEYPKQDHRATRRELEAVLAAADPAHPIGLYLQRTVSSWIVATHLLETLGTTEVTEHSVRLFGRPGDALPGNGPSNI